MDMKEIMAEVAKNYSAFINDAEAQVVKGNKAAGTRARKAALEMTKLLKEFRKVSVETSR